jgi:glycerophosphoryl diester phosphodiesterase
MNTLSSFELAADMGADGIELDVHRSKDGELVIVHDFTVDNTTDGEGAVSEMTLAELKSLDAGSWFDVKFKGAQIPTLDEVFDAVGRKLFINIEIKSLPPLDNGLEELVANKIADHGLAERVIVSSFNPIAISRFRQIAPQVATGYLTSPESASLVTPEMLDGLTYEALHPYFELVDADYVATAKKGGYRINTWTVNDPAQAIALCDLGVDGIITDYPDVIRHALDR